MTVELWGGPQDGTILAIATLQRDILFPVPSNLSDPYDQDADLVIGAYVYGLTGRRQSGRYVYKFISYRSTS